jgi:hypothetical protein
MATISIPGGSDTITQVGSQRGKVSLLSPHMITCQLAPDATDVAPDTTAKFVRVVPPYACDTWEIYVVRVVNDPQVFVYGLDDDYAGSGTPASGTAHELIDLPNGYVPETSGWSGTSSADFPRHVVLDQAWKGVQFKVSDSSGNGNAVAIIKVKAYRAGQCTYEGSYTTVTQETS